MKTNVVHIALHVSDLDRATQWYEETLGFDCTAAWPKEAPTYAHFDHEVGPRFALREDSERAGAGSVTFEIEDVETLWARVEGTDAVQEELYGSYAGFKKFVMRDPDGNELILQGKRSK